MPQHFLEKQVNDTFASTKERLFSIRQEKIKFYTVEPDGRLVGDPRFEDELNKLNLEDHNLRGALSLMTAARAQIIQVASTIRGCDHNAPLGWLIAREAALKKQIEDISTEANVLKQKIQMNEGLSTGDWPARVQAFDNQVAELQPEYQKVSAARQQVFAILQRATQTR